MIQHREIKSIQKQLILRSIVYHGQTSSLENNHIIKLGIPSSNTHLLSIFMFTVEYIGIYMEVTI